MRYLKTLLLTFLFLLVGGAFSSAFASQGSIVYAYGTTVCGIVSPCLPSFQINALNLDTLASQVISPGPSDTDPDWSPDGKSVVLMRYVSNTKTILVIRNVATGAEQVIENTVGKNYYPSWSPDGKNIAFTSTRDGNAEIYNYAVGSATTTRLTTDAAVDQYPAWLGNTGIIFSSNRDGTFDLFQVLVIGGAAKNITTGATNETQPAVSGDGKKIAYVESDVATPGVSKGIRVLDLATGAITTLTSSVDTAPAWDPASDRIAVQRAVTGGFGVIILDSKGVVLGFVNGGPLNEMFPDWLKTPRAPTLTTPVGPAGRLPVDCSDPRTAAVAAQCAPKSSVGVSAAVPPTVCKRSRLYSNKVASPSTVALKDLVSKRGISTRIWASQASKGKLLLYMPNSLVRKLNLAQSKRKENVIGQQAVTVSDTEIGVRLKLKSHKIVKLRAALKKYPHLALAKLRIALKTYPVEDYGLYVTSQVGLKAVPKARVRGKVQSAASSNPIDLCNKPLEVKVDGAPKLQVKKLFNAGITSFSGVEVSAYCSKACDGTVKAVFRLERKKGQGYVFSNKLKGKKSLLLASAPVHFGAGQQQTIHLTGKVSPKIRQAVKKALHNSGNTRYVNLIYLLNGSSGKEHKLALGRSKLSLR